MSPHGLALDESRFWGLTWIEIEALTEQWRGSRDMLFAHFAGIQATLHNAHFKHPTGGTFKAQDFMPNSAPIDDRTAAERLEDQKLALWNALSMAAAVTTGKVN